MKRNLSLPVLLFGVLLLIGGCRTVANYFFPVAPYDQKTSLTNLKMIGLAMNVYADANRDQLCNRTGVDGLNLLAYQYIRNFDTFVAPFDSHRDKGTLEIPMREEQISYAWIGDRLGVPRKEAKDAHSVPIALEKPWIRTDDVVGVLYLDGHVGLLAGEFHTCEEVVNRLRGESKEPYWNGILESARAVDRARTP